MDFNGHFALAVGRCHPLSVLDDRSRFLLGLVACGEEGRHTVQTHLTRLFECYGLPRRILSDNGSPWGAPSGGRTMLEVWLLQLGVQVSHGRAGHPETQGKVERFYRTLKAEVVSGARFADLASCQAAVDRWRLHYNTERSHDALELAVPISRYQPSPRTYPDQLPIFDYAPEEPVRTVKQDGFVAYQGGHYRVGKGWRGSPVALRPPRDPQVVQVYLGRHFLTTLDLEIDRSVSSMSPNTGKPCPQSIHAPRGYPGRIRMPTGVRMCCRGSGARPANFKVQPPHTARSPPPSRSVAEHRTITEGTHTHYRT